MYFWQNNLVLRAMFPILNFLESLILPIICDVAVPSVNAEPVISNCHNSSEEAATSKAAYTCKLNNEIVVFMFYKNNMNVGVVFSNNDLYISWAEIIEFYT